MSIIAIITARGGSKRIPKKNIKEFCGKPIIAYSIEAALQAGIFDEVMVSTDSEEIKTVSEAHGSTVPFLRSEATSNDYSTTADVIEEVVGQYKAIGRQFEYVFCIYPTAPFVTAARLKDAWEKLKNSDADAIAAIVRYSFPPQRSFVIRNGVISYQFPEYKNSRSQDLEPIYHDCGQFYCCRTSTFLKYHSLIVPNTIPYIVREEEMQDIDTISDWKIAEAKYAVLHKGEL